MTTSLALDWYAATIEHSEFSYCSEVAITSHNSREAGRSWLSEQMRLEGDDRYTIAECFTCHEVGVSRYILDLKQANLWSAMTRHRFPFPLFSMNQYCDFGIAYIF